MINFSFTSISLDITGILKVFQPWHQHYNTNKKEIVHIFNGVMPFDMLLLGGV